MTNIQILLIVLVTALFGYPYSALADTTSSTQNLIEAAGKGNKSSIQDALNQEANVNGVASNGYTALYAAAEKGHAHIVQLLLLKGAKPNVAIDQHSCCPGWTPLMIAAAE